MADIKLLFKGELKLDSPLIIGSGEGNNTDNDILLNHKNEPFIPGSSIAGIISSAMDKTDIDKAQIKEIFGYGEKQSQIVFYDLLLKKDTKFTITKRDGIAINNKTGITLDKSKFDYEVIDKDAIFDFNILCNFYDEKLLGTIVELFNSGKVKIGAKTNNGFGEVKLTNYKIYAYDLSKKKDVITWLRKSNGRDITEELLKKKYSYTENYISLNLMLSIKDSLIIKSYEDNEFEADSTHLKSNGDNIISGSSFKGALRARAERIYNTLSLNTNMLIGNLFGSKGESDGAGQKGRFAVNEVKLPDMVSEMQHRIKIDRFTGGTMIGALFDSMPLFSSGEKIEKMEIKIADAKESDLGLLLLLMKDLWSGDLAIGGEKNIGRGVFKGVGATINYSFNNNKKIVSINEDLKGLKENEVFFQNCIDKLKEENK